MSDYGKNTKKIVFTDTDHRHAQLLIRLKHDGMKQSEFFRAIVGGYIEGDERLQNYIDEVSTLSKKRKGVSKTLRARGKSLVNDLGLNDGEIENIFDILEEEYPEL